MVAVGRLTRSLPLSRPHALPVYVARVPAAPFCEPRKHSGLAQTPYNLNQRGRRVREDVRAKEEWLNPCGRQLRACREANIKLWWANNRRLGPVLITAGRYQRDRADVVTTIRVTVNASVQSRRDADEKCPGERCKEYGRNKNTRASL